MVTAEELVVSITSEGTQETQDDLEGVESTMEDTADSAGDSADELEGFSKRFSGALSAAVAGLAVGAAGLLSQVPVIGEAMSGLFAILEALAFQMDSVLRPVLTPIGDFFFDMANAIFEADGAMGTLTGTFGTVAAGAGILIGVLKLIGVALTGPLLAAIGVVAGAIAALWLAWRENFGGIQDVAQDTIDNVSERFSDFVETVKPIVMGFLDTLESAWGSHGETIMDVVNFAFRTIGALIETGIDAILTIIEVGLQILSGNWEGAWESMTDFFSRMVDLWGPLLSEAIDAIIGLMFGLASDLGSWARDLASDAFDWGVSLAQGLLDGIVSLTGTVVEAFQDVINGIIDTINRALDILPDEVTSRVGVESFEQVDFDTDFGSGRGREATNGRGASGRPRFGAGRGASTGGQQIDGRQISESTGRYRSDPANRRGI